MFPPTFDPDTLELVGPAEILSFQADGVTSFDGRGNFTSTVRATAIFSSRIDMGAFPIGHRFPLRVRAITP